MEEYQIFLTLVGSHNPPDKIPPIFKILIKYRLDYDIKANKLSVLPIFTKIVEIAADIINLKFITSHNFPSFIMGFSSTYFPNFNYIIGNHPLQYEHDKFTRLIDC